MSLKLEDKTFFLLMNNLCGFIRGEFFSPGMMLDSADKIHDSQVQDHMGKDEICKGTLWADLLKLALVGWVDLEPQASCMTKRKQL